MLAGAARGLAVTAPGMNPDAGELHNLRRAELRKAWVRTMCRIDGTHDAYSVAVRILDDGIAGSPEGVVGLVLSSVASSGQVGIDGIDTLSAGDFEADHHSGAGRPSFGPVMSELGPVEMEIDAARSLSGSMVGLEGGVSVGDSQSQAAVEGHGGFHV